MPDVSYQNYLSLRLGEQWYGIDVRHVVEVLHMVELTALPAPESAALGLMTLRDVVMPVIDLRRYFGTNEATFSLTTPIVAVHAPGQPIALVVDEVDTVERISATDLISYEGPDCPEVSGVAKLPDKLLLLLDLGSIEKAAGTATVQA